MKRGKIPKAFNFTQFDFRSKYSGTQWYITEFRGPGRKGACLPFSFWHYSNCGADHAHNINTAPPPFLDLPSPLVLNKFRAIWGTNRVSDNKGQMRHCVWGKFKDTEKINPRNFGYILISRNTLLLDKDICSFLFDMISREQKTVLCSYMYHITYFLHCKTLNISCFKPNEI